MTKGRRDTRQTGVVEQAAGADFGQAGRDGAQRLVPRDWYEPGILRPPLARVGPLHRSAQTIGIVSLLDQPKRPDADATIARVDAGGGEIRQDFRRHAVYNFDC
jgi:hypothetical protein